eukprot:GHVN01074986.1.p1 GENE.GHVN01074986.1~~GHVN01074986.1.p1  ORF type:complete len:208 (+),score=35.62 GHVN01074986.1:665-1288(+)
MIEKSGSGLSQSEDETLKNAIDQLKIISAIEELGQEYTVVYRDGKGGYVAVGQPVDGQKLKETTLTIADVTPISSKESLAERIEAVILARPRGANKDNDEPFSAVLVSVPVKEALPKSEGLNNVNVGTLEKVPNRRLQDDVGTDTPTETTTPTPSTDDELRSTAFSMAAILLIIFSLFLVLMGLCCLHGIDPPASFVEKPLIINKEY